MSADWYNEDLAHIHDDGFVDHARRASPGILACLRDAGIADGLIVDLGCGSGVSALDFTNAGYDVLGIDISEPMIALARERVPSATFRAESLFSAELPACDVVTSVGECLNYLFDSAVPARDTLVPLFERVHVALRPGGLFLFDLLGPGQVGPDPVRSFREGDGWLVLVEKTEDSASCELTRRIITLRQVGATYRRTDETHRVRLYEPEDVLQQLRHAGFSASTHPGYGAEALPPAHTVFRAHKTA